MSLPNRDPHDTEGRIHVADPELLRSVRDAVQSLADADDLRRQALDRLGGPQSVQVELPGQLVDAIEGLASQRGLSVSSWVTFELVRAVADSIDVDNEDD